MTKHPSPLFASLLAFLLHVSANADSMFIDEIYGFKETEDIVYSTGSTGNPTNGSIDLSLDLFEPTGVDLPAKSPALVMIHGGGFTGGSKDDAELNLACQKFAQRGYVVVSIQYRLAGDDPTLEPGPTLGLGATERAVNAAIQDAAKAIRWLRENADTYHIDPTRIGIGGGSSGAITSLYTASLEADIIGANAEVGVVIDLWGGMSGSEFFFDSSDPAVFIAHGTLDSTILVTESEALVTRLNAVNIPHAYYPLAGAGHGAWSRYFNDIVNGKTVFQHSVEFTFEQLNLIELHPAGTPTTNQPTLTIDAQSNELTYNFPTYNGFQYIVSSSSDLITWSPLNADSPIAGDDTIHAQPVPSTSGNLFYRVEVSTNF